MPRVYQRFSRQQRRKLSQLKTAAEKALWFVESFGLDLPAITFKTSSTNKVIGISFGPESATIDASCVRQTLYLLERFGVSDEFYHELAMINSALPRSHIVKQTRQLITESVEIQRLPEPYNGTYRPFKECLLLSSSLLLLSRSCQGCALKLWYVYKINDCLCMKL